MSTEPDQATDAEAVEESVPVEEPKPTPKAERAERKPLLRFEDDDGNLLTPAEIWDGTKSAISDIKIDGVDAAVRPAREGINAAFSSFLGLVDNVRKSLADEKEKEDD
jgi:hypothetical protein